MENKFGHTGWLSTTIFLPDVTSETILNLFSILFKGFTTNIDSKAKTDVHIAAKLLGFNISLDYNNDGIPISNFVIERDAFVTDTSGQESNKAVDEFQNIGIEIKRELDKMLTLSEPEIYNDDPKVNLMKNILQLDQTDSINEAYNDLSKSDRDVEFVVSEIPTSLNDLGSEEEGYTSGNYSSNCKDSISGYDSEIATNSLITEIHNRVEAFNKNGDENLGKHDRINKNSSEKDTIENDTERKIKEILDISTIDEDNDISEMINGVDEIMQSVSLKKVTEETFTNCSICNYEFSQNWNKSLEHYFNHLSSEAKSTYGHLVKDDGTCKICSKKRIQSIQHVAITHKKMREIFDKKGIPYPKILLTEANCRDSGFKRKREFLDNEIDNNKNNEETSMTPEEASEEVLVCKVCQSGYANTSSLLVHYSGHFQSNLKEKYGNLISGDGKCLKCGKIIKGKNQLKHLGVTHRYIYDILEEKFSKDSFPAKRGLRIGNNNSNLELNLKDPTVKETIAHEYNNDDSIKTPEISTNFQAEINKIKDSLTHIKSEPIDDNINTVSDTEETSSYIKAESLDACESATNGKENNLHNNRLTTNATSVSEPKKSTSNEDFSCKLCAVTVENTEDLLGHYSKHYHKELQDGFGHLISSDGHCKECNNKINGPIIEQMMHLGAAHKKILPIIMKLLEKSTNQGNQNKDPNLEDEKINNGNEMRKHEILNADKHKCLICGIVIQPLTELKFLVHYCKHFKNMLKAQAVNFYNNDLECKQCGKKYSTNKLTVHMGATHKKLWPILASELGLGGPKKKNSIVNEVKEEKSMNNCLECDKSYSEISDWQTHLIKDHYLLKILSKYGNKQRHCDKCDEKFEDNGAFAMHLGIVHHILDKFSERNDTTISETKDVKVEITNFNVKLEKHLSCPNCTVFLESREDLIEHLCKSHFKKAILNKYGNSKKHCEECNETFQEEDKFATHIGYFHCKLVEFSKVSGAAQAKRKNRGIENKADAKIISNLEEETEPTKVHLEDSELPGLNEDEIQKFSCFQCENSYQTRGDLYQHYSYAHYSSQLMEKFGVQSICNMTNCNDIFSGVANWINHIGETHDMVQQFIPKVYQVKKT